MHHDLQLVYSIQVCSCTSVIIAIVEFILRPRDVTVCRTQMTEAEFTCIVDRHDVNITAVHWQMLVEREFQLLQEMPRHVIESSTTVDIITGVLTVTDVMMNDNGNQYQCSPTETTMSGTATLTVLSKSINV